MGKDRKAGAAAGLDESKSSGYSDFARRQLMKFGWEEGKGLGKNESGITKHVAVLKKDDNAGVGMERAEIQQVLSHEWWHNPFDAALKKMAKGKRRRRDETDSSAPPSLEDVFKATGGLRLGMRARASQVGKWKRTESIDSSIATHTSVSVELLQSSASVTTDELADAGTPSTLETQTKKKTKKKHKNVHEKGDMAIADSGELEQPLKHDRRTNAEVKKKKKTISEGELKTINGDVTGKKRKKPRADV